MANPKFTLDSRIPEEAALMQRLANLPADRHAEYLRSLALRGFGQECAELTSTNQEQRPSSTSGIPPRIGLSSNRETQTANTQAAIPRDRRASEKPADEVSLASLQAVVG